MKIENCIEDMEKAAYVGGQLAMSLREDAKVADEEWVEMDIVKKYIKDIDVSYLVQLIMLRILRNRNSICGIIARESDEKSRKIKEDFSHQDKFTEGKYTLVVNPIDGKKNFSEPGCDTSKNYGSCVHLAKGNEMIAGAIHMPEHDSTITTLRGGGTYIDSERITIEKDTDFSFENTARIQLMGDKIESMFVNPYPRAACAVLLSMLRNEIKTYLAGGVTVINFGSLQTAYEEAGGVVRDADGNPLKTHKLMTETDRGLILRGFIGMTPSDKYFQKMMKALQSNGCLR